MAKVISFKTSGNLKKTDRFLSGIIQRHYRRKLERFGAVGVKALQEATPKDTGLTAESWSYEIVEEGNRLGLYWRNSNRHDGALIAVLLQYGHGTGTGGWVEGLDYINPAIRPVFTQIANEVWKEVVG